MPYYLESDNRELLGKLRFTQVCAECGSPLEALYDIDKHLPYLVCSKVHGHEGIGKPNKKEDNSYEGGLRQMVQVEREHGFDKARQLTQYQGVTSLTRPQAIEILETIWPDAPAPDKLAAAILCSSYGLNPLAGHVFLIPFKDKSGQKTWARVWGIKAKRLLASRKGGYSYLDMTPRLMTEKEQIKVWGEVDQNNLCYMTHLADMQTGAEVYGYGKWPKSQIPYGTDKGNSQANMASIRSESQALDRLRPAEMPTGFAIADEQYIEGEGREVDVSTGEIIEQPAKSEPSPASPESTPEPLEQETKPMPPADTVSMPWPLKETLRKIKWQETTAKGWLLARKWPNLTANQSLEEMLMVITSEQRETFNKEIENRLKGV